MDDELEQLEWLQWIFTLSFTLLFFGIAYAFSVFPGQSHTPSGFWGGLVHGAFAPISLMVSFVGDLRMYDVANVGRAYDFGFVLGASVGFSLGSLLPRVGKKQRDPRDVHRFLRGLKSPWV